MEVGVHGVIGSAVLVHVIQVKGHVQGHIMTPRPLGDGDDCSSSSTDSGSCNRQDCPGMCANTEQMS